MAMITFVIHPDNWNIRVREHKLQSNNLQKARRENGNEVISTHNFEVIDTAHSRFDLLTKEAYHIKFQKQTHCPQDRDFN